MPPKRKRIFKGKTDVKAVKDDITTSEDAEEAKLLAGDDEDITDDCQSADALLSEDAGTEKQTTSAEKSGDGNSGGLVIEVEVKDIFRGKPKPDKKPEVSTTKKDTSGEKTTTEEKKVSDANTKSGEVVPAEDKSTTDAATTAGTETVVDDSISPSSTNTEIKVDEETTDVKVEETKVETPMETSDEKAVIEEQAIEKTGDESTDITAAAGDSAEPMESETTNATDTGNVKDEATKEEVKDSKATTSTTGTGGERLDERIWFKENYPESLKQLRQLTVNIGPIRQRDLMSKELHGILALNTDFEIKFELKKKPMDDGSTKREKLGYIRVPFVIRTPRFLITIANKLGNLTIDGRDMSVKFPEAFNKALADANKFEVEHKELIAKSKKNLLDLKKRQIIVRNVPSSTTEETLRSLFPEASKVSINMRTLENGTEKVGSVYLEFSTEAACAEFIDTNTDVQIEDAKVTFTRLDRKNRQRTNKSGQSGKPPQSVKKDSGVSLSNAGKGRATPQGSVKKQNKPGRMGPPPPRVGRGNHFNIKGNVKRGGHQMNRNSQDRRNNQSGQFSGFGNKNNSPVRSPQTAASMRNRGGRNQRGARGGGQGFTNDNRRNSFGSQGSSDRSPNRNTRPSFGGMQQQRSNFGGNQHGSSNMSRNQQSPSRSHYDFGNRGAQTQKEDDPMAMMAYLKSTLARMEEKISSRGGDGDRGGRRDDYNSSNSYSGGGGGYNRGGNNAGNDRKRKRKDDYNKDKDLEAKRLYQMGSGNADNRDRQGSNYSIPGTSSSTYSYQGYSNYGNQGSGYSIPSSTYSNNQMGSYGNQPTNNNNNQSNNYGNPIGVTGTFTGQSYNNPGSANMTGTGTSNYGNNTTYPISSNVNSRNTGNSGQYRW